MTKLIIRFMNFAIGFIAGIFVIAGGLGGIVSAFFAFDDDLSGSVWLMMISVPLGLVAGLMCAAIILGIPLLAIRINQNLEEINSNIKIYLKKNTLSPD